MTRMFFSSSPAGQTLFLYHSTSRRLQCEWAQQVEGFIYKFHLHMSNFALMQLFLQLLQFKEFSYCSSRRNLNKNVFSLNILLKCFFIY